MLVGDFRELARQKQARWALPHHLEDHVELARAAPRRALGALATPPGAAAARQPRLRGPADRPVVPWQPEPGRRLLLRTAARPLGGALPRRWDWRDVGGHSYVSPARDQGGCGSCVAFAITAAVESHRRIQLGRPELALDLSESSLFFVHERQCNLGDPGYGWWIDQGLDAVVRDGICAEECYPYRAVNQNAELVDGAARTLRAAGYDSTSSTALMKRWLAEEGPLVTMFTVHRDFYAFWNGDDQVYSEVDPQQDGGHAVVVVGYDDDARAWICKNSWGATPHRPDGCFRIGYGECGIDERMYLVQDLHDVVTRDELPYDPRALHVIDEGSTGWLLTDGTSRMKMFDTAEDARNGLRVARRHTRHGYVGRDNPRANRLDYVVEYWTGHSGLPWEPLTRTDTIAYHPATVVAEDRDAAGWLLRDGAGWMVLAHDLDDALAALRVVERHSRVGFIGRGNQRPDRKRYIMTYWE